jgi:hypothetical protein
MAGHIGYEFTTCVEGLLLWEADEQATALALEVCLLHARSLIEFLVGRDGRRPQYDIHPTDYVPDWKVDAATRTWFQPWLATADKLVSHLSLTRVANEPLRHGTYRELVERLVGLMTSLAEQSDFFDGPVAVARSRLGMPST